MKILLNQNERDLVMKVRRFLSRIGIGSPIYKLLIIGEEEYRKAYSGHLFVKDEFWKQQERRRRKYRHS